MGQLFGQMSIKGNVGTYNSKNYGNDFNCMLKFEFNSEELKITTDEVHNDCGFGHSVYADNTYKIVNKTIPKHFINVKGDAILFDGLTVEKYYHRNN
jgi:hypothetical protein